MHNSSKGSALIVGLIMLIVLTLFALTSIKLAKSSSQMVANMQHRDAVTWAANSVLEEAVSTKRLVEAPEAVFLTPCKGANTRCFDLNNDSTNDVTVALTPTPHCVTAKTIKSVDLDITDTEDAGCVMGDAQNFGVAGASSGESMCANSIWDVTAVATDEVTEATITINAGYAVRVDKNDVDKCV